MPLQKILLRPGVNRENTRYTTEGGWYESDKVRFRQGTPEAIGGWQRISASYFEGVCRSMWAWVTLFGQQLLSVGTNKKYYISSSGYYYDVTPITNTATLSNPFTAVNGSPVITVAQTAHGYDTGDYVTFYSATGLGGAITAAVLNQNYEITVTGPNSYTITASVNADAGDTGHGGTCYVAHQLAPGPAIVQPLSGWGAGPWSSGSWGIGTTSVETIRIYSQMNFGEDLIFGYRGGPMYYWDASYSLQNTTTVTMTIASPCVVSSSLTMVDGAAVAFSTTGQLPTGLVPQALYYVVNSTGLTFNVAATPGGTPIVTTGTQSGTHSFSTRAIPLTSFSDASQVPTIQNYILISDASRFVFAFGANEIYTTTQDPMLIRWSDQENPAEWQPQVTNQAGSIRLSHGSQIVTAIQTRQEIVVFTDTSLYSLQYIGAPYVWGNQLMGDNISIISQNAASVASNVVYWMGIDKFYMYDGTVKTLRCDLRRHIFEDINTQQYTQVISGTNEGFNEVWWFYCSAGSLTVDRYVIYNYAEDIWTYGTMARTAWLDSGIFNYPLAATYQPNIVQHETGVNDNATGDAQPIHSYITSSEFDIGDGHNFAFIWRILPDLTFRGSTSSSPQVTIYLYPLQNSGSGYSDPASEGGENYATVTRTVALPVEEFTGQIYTRVRGRQMAIKIEGNQVGTTWQLGAPRIDIRQDGRR